MIGAKHLKRPEIEPKFPKGPTGVSTVFCNTSPMTSQNVKNNNLTWQFFFFLQGDYMTKEKYFAHMTTLSKALKIYNVYKTFNETAKLDLKTLRNQSRDCLSSIFRSPQWLNI